MNMIRWLSENDTRNNILICANNLNYYDPYGITNLEIEIKDQLFYLPEIIYELKNLQSLTLRGNKNLKNKVVIPKTIIKFQNIKIIKIINIPNVYIPNELFEIKSLEILTIKKCNLKKINQLTVICENLKFLDLSNNKLNCIPNNIHSIFPCIKFLDISNNKIEYFPLELYHINFYVFKCNNNDIYGTEDNIKILKIIIEQINDTVELLENDNKKLNIQEFNELINYILNALDSLVLYHNYLLVEYKAYKITASCA